jgi:ACS family hexuronate transporter-like MFS transporter
MLCLASELNYLDRQTLSVLAATIQKDLGLTDVDYSRVTSAFLMSYTLMYAVAGRLVDRLGTRLSFIVFVSAWSAANMLHGLARTALQLSFFRVLLGAAEPASFPGGLKAVSEWFPMRERALGVGIFNAGTALGGALAVPVVSFIALQWGWRWAFVGTGALGFVWVAAWAAFYRLPQDHPRLGAEERALIFEEGDATREAEPSAPVSLARLLGMRAVWGCVLARALTDPISYFLNFWIPKYLQAERGFTLAALGRYGWIPFAALAAGNIFSGAMPRWLISRGWPLDRARKATMLAVSLAMPVLCFLVTRVESQTSALAVVSALFFGHSAWGNITLPAEVFPRHAVGTVTGLGGALGGLVGVVTQLAIGRVVRLSFALRRDLGVPGRPRQWLVGERAGRGRSTARRDDQASHAASDGGPTPRAGSIREEDLVPAAVPTPPEGGVGAPHLAAAPRGGSPAGIERLHEDDVSPLAEVAPAQGVGLK